ERLVAPDHGQQIAMSANAQRRTDVTGVRILVDHQYVFAVARHCCRKIDYSRCPARARVAGSNSNYAQEILYQQTTQSLCLVMDSLSQGAPRSYPDCPHRYCGLA